MLRRINQDLSKSLQRRARTGRKLGQAGNDARRLVINVFDRSRKPIFEAQSTKFTPMATGFFHAGLGDFALPRIFPSNLGPHRKRQSPIRADYGDWEISADRANAVRRKLLEHGVHHAVRHSATAGRDGFGHSH
jgi:hypothetical protein